VAEDLQRLLPLADNSAIRAVIENGAKLIHDETLAKQMMPLPDPSRQVMQASNDWLRKHPYPKDDDPLPVRAAYGKELLAQAEDWRKLAPESLIGYSNRVRALALMRAPLDEIARAGDELLTVVKRGARADRRSNRKAGRPGGDHRNRSCTRSRTDSSKLANDCEPTCRCVGRAG
jgi:hypothetical protein